MTPGTKPPAVATPTHSGCVQTWTSSTPFEPGAGSDSFHPKSGTLFEAKGRSVAAALHGKAMQPLQGASEADVKALQEAFQLTATIMKEQDDDVARGDDNTVCAIQNLYGQLCSIQRDFFGVYMIEVGIMESHISAFRGQHVNHIQGRGFSEVRDIRFVANPKHQDIGAF